MNRELDLYLAATSALMFGIELNTGATLWGAKS